MATMTYLVRYGNHRKGPDGVLIILLILAAALIIGFLFSGGN